VANAEWVLAVYTGTSWTHSSDLRISQPGSGSNAEFHGVRWESKPFASAPYYGVRVSYFPESSCLGANIDFTHYKMYAETDRVTSVRGTWNGLPIDTSVPMSALVQTFEISHGVNLTSLNVEYRRPFDQNSEFTRRWSMHAGAGVAVYLPHAEGSINGISSAGNYQRAGEGYQLFAGAEFRLMTRLGVFFDTKFDDGELDFNLAPAARVQTRTRTVHALAGLAWHF
jgi:hypothetical protein